MIIIAVLILSSCSTSATGPGNGAIQTIIDTVSVDTSVTYQTIAGFGGFGGLRTWYSGGPYTSQSYVKTVVNDLGVTIIRDELPTSFEYKQDHYDINSSIPGLDTPVGDHFTLLKALKQAGVNKFIVSVWSPPAWMKTNNSVNNGTKNNSAPPYNPNPDSTDNQLRTDMYGQFAHMVVRYIDVIKANTGIDLYGLSIQNEPRFSQYYASCVYNGDALRDLLKVVADSLRVNNLQTKLFIPEDVGYMQGIENMLYPSLNDPEARKDIGMIAVHGYAFDGVSPSSADAQTWRAMYNWGSPYNIPLWMTETSGFKNDWNGAMSLGMAMYTALKFGNVSAWLWWTLSTDKLDEYSLMNSSGQKSKRYYVSKNFYKYIRPGAVRISASTNTSDSVYALAFRHRTGQTITLVLLNRYKDASVNVHLSGNGLPATFEQYGTSEKQDCKDLGTVGSGDVVKLEAESVMTLVGKN